MAGTRTYASGHEKRKKKRRMEAMAQSQAGAIKKFFTTTKQAESSNANPVNEVPENDNDNGEEVINEGREELVNEERINEGLEEEQINEEYQELNHVMLDPWEAYDALDPTGNITIKWDFMSWTPDGYVIIAQLLSKRLIPFVALDVRSTCRPQLTLLLTGQPDMFGDEHHQRRARMWNFT